MTTTELPTYTRDEVRAHRATLVAALRSSRYLQGNGQLRSNSRRFCCLGVLEDVRGCTWMPRAGTGKVGNLPLYVQGENNKRGIFYDKHLSPAGMNWLGVVRNDPSVYVGGDAFADVRMLLRREPLTVEFTTLASMNDCQVPFTRIADVLEKQRDDWDGTQASCERYTAPVTRIADVIEAQRVDWDGRLSTCRPNGEETR